MPEPKPLKRIDIHADYVMFQLMVNARQALGVLSSYMQNTTPYGDAYKKCLETYHEIYASFEGLEDALQECIEARSKSKK